MKRYINSKHKGLTPSKANELEIINLSKSKESLLKRFKCEDCKKFVYDKSNLNCHKKTYNSL